MKRNTIFKILISFSFILPLAFAHLTLAASSAIQIINIPVATITAFTTSGNPSAFIINTAIPGMQPTDEVNATTTYSISTNESNKKITGMLNNNMPANTYLKIRLAAPSGATSTGDVILTTRPADLVTGITKIAESGKIITYTFSSTVAAGMITSGRRTVILTVTD
jgi:hypothetical protein